MGGGLVIDGQVQFGAHYAAGHIGHLPHPLAAGLTCSCGAKGHIETVASGSGQVELYNRDKDVYKRQAIAMPGTAIMMSIILIITSERLRRTTAAIEPIIAPKNRAINAEHNPITIEKRPPISKRDNTSRPA